MGKQRLEQPLNKVSKLKVGMSMIEPIWRGEHGEVNRYERILGLMLRHENTSEEVVPIAPADLLCGTQPTSAGSHLGIRPLSTNKGQGLYTPQTLREEIILPDHEWQEIDSRARTRSTGR
jgi:hypothetical protein